MTSAARRGTHAHERRGKQDQHQLGAPLTSTTSMVVPRPSICFTSSTVHCERVRVCVGACVGFGGWVGGARAGARKPPAQAPPPFPRPPTPLPHAHDVPPTPVAIAIPIPHLQVIHKHEAIRHQRLGELDQDLKQVGDAWGAGGGKEGCRVDGGASAGRGARGRAGLLASSPGNNTADNRGGRKPPAQGRRRHCRPPPPKKDTPRTRTLAGDG